MNKTRQQYMNGECSHEEFYSQFVDDYNKSVVLSHFTKEEIKQAYKEDKHLNNLGKRFTGGSTTWSKMFPSIESIRLLQKLGDINSLASRVCIMKATAREIIK